MSAPRPISGVLPRKYAAHFALLLQPRRPAIPALSQRIARRYNRRQLTHSVHHADSLYVHKTLPELQHG